MEYYVAFDSMRKVRKKHKTCRVDSVMVHAAAQQITGAFSVDYLADIVELPPSDVRQILSSSTYFRSDGESFCKRERLASLYKGALVAFQDGEMVNVSFTDIKKKDVLIKEPLIDYFMEVVRRFGDCITLQEMAIQMTIYEHGRESTLDAIMERTQCDDRELVKSKLDNLVSNGLLVTSDKEGILHYRYTAMANDIFHIIFKARAGS